MKNQIEEILCRFPSAYQKLVLSRKPCNYEKLAYLRLVKREDTVLEVGANLGYFTRLFGNLVGGRGSVLAFEPVPQTRESLLRNVQDLKQVTVLPYAISDEVGQFEMFIPGDTHGQASLRRHCDSGWGATGEVSSVVVESRRLTEIKQVENLQRINFIKVDAEGADLKVLSGAREILERDHPVLHLEIEERWMSTFDYTVDHLETFLRSVGYTTFCTYDQDWIFLDSLKGLNACNLVCAINNQAISCSR